MGVYLTIEVFIVDCTITDVIAADQHISDKTVRAIKTKVYNLNIALRVCVCVCVFTNRPIMI